MFSELPKLFDRNFAIAYFLPVSLFLAASTWLLKVMGINPYGHTPVAGLAI
jgi:hypothetical protein